MATSTVKGINQLLAHSQRLGDKLKSEPDRTPGLGVLVDIAQRMHGISHRVGVMIPMGTSWEMRAKRN